MRSPRTGLAAALLFAVAFVGGYLLAFRLGPERLRLAAQASLSRALGAPVALEAARLRIGARGLGVDLSGISAWPEIPGGGLSIAHAELTIDPLGLVFGGMHLEKLRLDGLRLRIVRQADGTVRPAPVGAFLARAGGSASSSQPAREGLATRLMTDARALLRAALRAPVGTVDLELADARIELDDAAASSGRSLRFALDGLEGHALVRAPSRGLVARARARLLSEDREIAWLELQGDRGGSDLQLTVAATSLDLAPLAPYLQPLVRGARLRGRASGVIDLAASSGGHARLALDLVTQDAFLELPRGVGAAAPGETPRPAVLASPHAVVTGSLEVDPDAWRIADVALHGTSIDLDVEGRLARPVDDHAPLSLRARLASLGLEQAWSAAAWVPGAAGTAVRRALDPIEAGRAREVELRGDAPVGTWRALLEGDEWAGLAHLELDGALEGLRLRAGQRSKISELSGRLHFEDGTLALQAMHGRLDDAALPVLDVTVAGFANLLMTQPAHRTPPADVPALPGIEAFGDLVAEANREDPTPGWSQIRVDADQVLHPALLFPVEDLHAVLQRTPQGVHVVAERARWGGASLRGEGDWRVTPDPHVTARLEVAAPTPAVAPAARLSAPLWARGRFAVEQTRVLGLSFHSGEGSFTAAGARLTLGDLNGRVEPDGVLTGALTLDLSRRDGLPLQASLALRDASLDALDGLLHLDPADASGRVEVSTTLGGDLRAGAPAARTLTASIPFHARDGEIRLRLPLLLAIARASDTFNPFASRDRIRYRDLQGELRLEDGRLRSESLSIDSPDLRLVLSGAVDVASPAHEVEAVVGVFFFKALDRVVGLVPVLSTILQGKQQGMFGAFFAVTGPWSDPRASLIPTRSFASGPTSFVLDSVPGFVRSGLHALESVVPGLGAAVPPERPAAPRAESGAAAPGPAPAPGSAASQPTPPGPPAPGGGTENRALEAP